MPRVAIKIIEIINREKDAITAIFIKIIEIFQEKVLKIILTTTTATAATTRSPVQDALARTYARTDGRTARTHNVSSRVYMTGAEITTTTTK